MKLLTDVFARPFVVYQIQRSVGPGESKAKQVLAVLPTPKADLSRPVYLLYCGNHFDALVPIDTTNP
jgi:hypothetical protein